MVVMCWVLISVVNIVRFVLVLVILCWWIFGVGWWLVLKVIRWIVLVWCLVLWILLCLIKYVLVCWCIFINDLR